jgi:hypothetical protein
MIYFLALSWAIRFSVMHLKSENSTNSRNMAIPDKKLIEVKYFTMNIVAGSFKLWSFFN